METVKKSVVARSWQGERENRQRIEDSCNNKKYSVQYHNDRTHVIISSSNLLSIQHQGQTLMQILKGTDNILLLS
jgi:hypothetical protein